LSGRLRPAARVSRRGRGRASLGAVGPARRPCSVRGKERKGPTVVAAAVRIRRRGGGLGAAPRVVVRAEGLVRALELDDRDDRDRREARQAERRSGRGPAHCER
jgi:hypothetical protein